MEIANVHDAKTHLSQLLERVAQGELVVIARAGKPIATLVPYRREKKPRSPGALKGPVTILGDFNDMPEEFMRHFTGRR